MTGKQALAGGAVAVLLVAFWQGCSGGGEPPRVGTAPSSQNEPPTKSVAPGGIGNMSPGEAQAGAQMEQRAREQNARNQVAQENANQREDQRTQDQIVSAAGGNPGNTYMPNTAEKK